MESEVGGSGSVGVDGARLEELAPQPLLTRDYETRPSLVYERLRQQHGPVAPVDLLGVPAWLVLGYREALQVLQDDDGWPKGLENWRARSAGEVPADWPLGPSLEVNHVLIQGGPAHQPLRTAWDAALKPFQDPSHPQAKRLKAAVTAYADELITLLGQGGGTGVADLSAQFSRPLPLMVASHLLGFPGSQGDDALMDMWRVLDAGPDAEPALERLLATLAELAAVKLTEPGDDFPSSLLAAHPGLSLDELARELFMLLGMTSDHVGILMSNTVVEVISGDVGVRASLSAGMIRETMNRVVMRKPPLVNFVPRFAAEDTPLGNYTIRAGDPVWVSSAAAHADPLFADHVAPNSTISTRAHLSWGAGRRQCPARELASTVAAVGVGRLFERFSHLDLALPADQLLWRSSPFMRGLRSLPVRYELAPVTGKPPVSERSPPAADVGTADGAGHGGAVCTGGDRAGAAGSGHPAALVPVALSHRPDPHRSLTRGAATGPVIDWRAVRRRRTVEWWREPEPTTRRWRDAMSNPEPAPEARTTPQETERGDGRGSGMALLVIASCQLMVVLDITIVNIALPDIQRSLDFSTTSLSWVINAYTLTFGGLLLLGGRMGDILGRRRVFIFGVLLFVLASLLGGMAQNSWQLLAARALQGVGGAIASPTSLALISTTFREGPERNRAFGVFAAVSAGGGAIGLLAGGILVEWLNWRWVLFVNVPIGLLIALATPRWIPESERHPGHFDIAGALTSTIGMVLLVYGFIRAAQDGWREGLTLAAFGGAVVFLLLFILIERRSRQPITPLHMFADRNRAGTYGMMLSLAAAIFGMFFFLTLFVQNVLDFSPIQAGLAFLPVSAVIAVGAGLASQLLPRYGPKPFMVTGAILAAAGLAWLTLTDVHSTYAGSILGPILVFSLGMGMEFVSLTLMALSNVRIHETGAASGLLNATQQVGGSLGLSILVTMFGTASNNEADKQIPAFLAQATPVERLRFERTGQLPAHYADEVLTAGVSAAFIMAAIFTAIAAVIALLVIQVRPSDLERLQGGGMPTP